MGELLGERARSCTQREAFEFVNVEKRLLAGAWAAYKELIVRACVLAACVAFPRVLCWREREEEGAGRTSACRTRQTPARNKQQEFHATTQRTAHNAHTHEALRPSLTRTHRRRPLAERRRPPESQREACT